MDGIRARLTDLDIIRVQDTYMVQSPDPELLDWLANEGRILITHDVRTIPGFVYERVRVGLPMPGVIEVKRSTPIGQAIDELAIMIGAGVAADFENLVNYIPL